MGVTVLPPPGPSFGERAGAGFGQGLGAGLNEALQQMLQRRTQGTQGAALAQLLNLSNEQKQLIGKLSPEQQTKYLETFQKQARTNTLASAAGIPPEQVQGMDPNDLSQLIRSRAEESKATARREEFGQQHVEKAFSQTKKERSDITKGYVSSKEDLMRLDRMEKLLDEGKLISAGAQTLLKKFNLDFPVLKNPSSQEFEKLTNDMTASARIDYGARITNFDLETFLKRIPTLLNTDEGKRRVINDLRVLRKGKAVRYKAMREIIKENNGTPPLDLEERIEEKAAPELDKLASQFKEGVQETVSAGQKKLTSEKAQEILKMAKGNKAKARKIAQKQGYQF